MQELVAWESWWIVVPAGAAAAGGIAAMVRVGAVRPDLSGALGSDWEDLIPPDRRASMVTRWWRGSLAAGPEPRLRRDAPFATAPGTDRTLLYELSMSIPITTEQVAFGRRARPAGLAIPIRSAASLHSLGRRRSSKPDPD